MPPTPDNLYWVTTVLFGATYFGLAWGGFPGLRIDRAGVAFAGAAAMLAVGAISLPEAWASIDAATIALLLGMMIVVGCLQLAGFFAWATDRVAARFSGGYSLLAAVVSLSGILSALLVNDVVCVALTPLILKLCQRLRRAPLPYLMGLATASNIGSAATITGNPQNIIIGSLSGISYLKFAQSLAPVAAMGLILDFVIIAVIYRRDLSMPPLGPSEEPPPRVVIHGRLLAKVVAIVLGAVVLFFGGFPIAIVALAAAGLCLLEGIRPAKIYRHVDWPLLMMFAGLFVVVRTFEIHVVRGWNLQAIGTSLQYPVPVISGISVLLSNLVSNVPAVLLFRPLVEVLPNQELAWLTLAMSSTFAGNLTLLGSVANLIVAEIARGYGVTMTFFEYLKVGVVVTVLTTGIGILWLMLV
jgi:Na+/H+ antiporter NhaD/arsenite permease-like protein